MTDEPDTGTDTKAAPARPTFLTEDWAATVAGLAILALALLGLIPKAVLW